MQLELNGQLVSEQPNEQLIAQVVGQMRSGDILSLHRPPADFAQVTGSAAKGFMLNVYEDARGANLISARALDAAGITAALAGYLNGAPDWQTHVQWRADAGQQKGARRYVGVGAGLIAFAIFATALAAAMGMTYFSDTPAPLSAGDWLRGFAAITVIAGYIGWLDYFLRALRPRLARRLGAKLGIKVFESSRLYDAGTWETSGGSIGSRLLVYGLDILLLGAGTALPIAAPAVIAFMLFAG